MAEGLVPPSVEGRLQEHVGQYHNCYLEHPSNLKPEDRIIPAAGTDGVSNRMRPCFQPLKGGNVLPEHWNAARAERGDASPIAMKRELAVGHGVRAHIRRTQSGDATHMSADTWAQCTDD